MKIFGKILSVFAIAACVTVTGFVEAACSCSSSYAGNYIVNTSKLPLTMRSGHGSNYGKIMSIPKGATVYVSASNGTWAHVSYNGRNGYASMQYLRKVQSQSSSGIIRGAQVALSKSSNEQVKNNNEEEKVINYTDTTGILMKSVKKIVDSVSYVLIAFVSISLIVSSIMIGIITYISVLERTKEIGILRAIGASKKNISSIFNAETFIIGLLSGTIGIGISLFLLVFINQLIHKLTGNPDITAVLPLISSIILICLSVVLTLIGGLIPSRIASKKDPVEALRTE